MRAAAPREPRQDKPEHPTPAKGERLAEVALAVVMVEAGTRVEAPEHRVAEPAVRLATAQ
jgi:hypothetical protein